MCDLSAAQVFVMILAFLVIVWVWSGFIYYLGRKHEREEIERFQRKKRQWEG